MSETVKLHLDFTPVFAGMNAVIRHTNGRIAHVQLSNHGAFFRQRWSTARHFVMLNGRFVYRQSDLSLRPMR